MNDLQVAGLLVWSVICAAFGVILARDHWRTTSVEHGHAEYYIDHLHRKRWRWLKHNDE